MQIVIGSIVTHPLFQGPGTVVKINKEENGKEIFEVFWQSHGRNGFHSVTNLKLITENQ